MTAEGHPREKFLPNPKLKLREQLGEVMRFDWYHRHPSSSFAQLWGAGEGVEREK